MATGSDRQCNIWLDFESVGLSPSHPVIEVGIIATDENLDPLFEIDTLLLDGDIDDILAAIEERDVLREMHGANGLWDDMKRIKSGDAAYMTIEELDDLLAEQMTAHAIEGKKFVLAGSGTSHYDFAVIKHKMPKTTKLLDYFNRDIGIVRREFFEALGFDLMPVNDAKTHRAMQDVRDHLGEAEAFREFFIRAAAALGITKTGDFKP